MGEHLFADLQRRESLQSQLGDFRNERRARVPHLALGVLFAGYLIDADAYRRNRTALMFEVNPRRIHHTHNAASTVKRGRVAEGVSVLRR